MKCTLFTSNQTLKPNLNRKKMFKSIPFLIYFRILSPIWSFGCFVLALKVLGRSAKEISRNRSSPKTGVVICGFFIRQPNLRLICLSFHVMTHVSRMTLFAVDPFFSQQIFPHLAFYLLQVGSVTFATSTSILLSFVM